MSKKRLNLLGFVIIFSSKLKSSFFVQKMVIVVKNSADGLAITMSRYVTKCSREQVLGLRPDLRKVDKHLWNKELKLFLNEHFNYRLAS